MSKLNTEDQKITEFIGILHFKNGRLEEENKALKAEIVRLKAENEALKTEIDRTKAKTPDTTNKRKTNKQADTDVMMRMYAHREDL